MRTLRVAAIVASLIMALPGCGGDDKSNRDQAYKPGTTTTPANATADAAKAKADAAEAKAAARTATSGLESCYVDTQDYSQCKSADALKPAGVDVGTGPGQVNVTKATTTGYALEVKSKSGGVFTIEKQASGPVKRTCSGAGCSGGTW